MSQDGQPGEPIAQREDPVAGPHLEAADIPPVDDLPELPPQWALNLIERTTMIEAIINKAVDANFEFRQLLEAHVPVNHQDWIQVRKLTEDYDRNMIDLLEFCIPAVWEGLRRLREEFVELNIPDFPVFPIFDGQSPSISSNPTPPISSEASSTDTDF